MSNLYIVIEHTQSSDESETHYHIADEPISYHLSQEGATEFIDDKCKHFINEDIFMVGYKGMETEKAPIYTIRIEDLKP